MKLFKNCFRVLEVCQEKADSEEYVYFKPSDLFRSDYANETEAIQDVYDRQAKGEEIPGEYVILNVKIFEHEIKRKE